MKSNLELIQKATNYIEKELSNKLDIDEISKHFGYSKYHFHKMFSFIVEKSPYQYIKQRRLSEAAKMLLSTDMPIIDIAFSYGYESQQAFTDAFKRYFKMSPGRLRKKVKKLTFIPPFNSTDYAKKISKDDLYSLCIEQREVINLAGYSSNTLKGLFVIPRLWNLLHKNKQKIQHRIMVDRVFAINDYSTNQKCTKNRSFIYKACIAVENTDRLPKDMDVTTLPASDYAVFTFRANPVDSVEHILTYIYKEWFPLHSYQLNEKAMYELIEYGEKLDSNKKTDIKICIPIC